MGSNIGNGVSLRGITQDNFNYVFLADGITSADIGKAIAFKAGTTNTVKLAANGEFIIGNLFSYEDRVAEGIKVCTVQTEGGYLFPVDPNATSSSPDETPAPGEFIEGATATDTTLGYVRKVQSTARSKFMVVENVTLDSLAYVVAISV